MQIIILAGGFGTRLQSVVKDVPKPMADINGIPFLKLLMQELALLDPERFILCVSYKKEVIQNYFGDSFLGIDVVYSQEDTPLGTGGAIKQAFHQFSLEEALVLNGDTYVQTNLHHFIEKCQGSKLGMVLKQVDDANRYGKVDISGEYVVSFNEKTQDIQAGLINAGIYYVTDDALQAVPLEDVFSFEKDFLEPHIQKFQVPYVQSEEYFIDIGIPESYAQACRELKSVICGNQKHKALFLDRDGVINKEIHYLHTVEECVFMEGIFDLCRTYKNKGYKIIVVTNQAGIGKGIYSLEDYQKLRLHIHKRFQEEGCAIDAEYYCPYHIDGLGAYQRKSFYRKPNPGMILKAAKDFDIDLSQSFLIGDQVTDIEAAKAAGITQYKLVGEKCLQD